MNALKRLEAENEDLFECARDVILNGWEYAGEKNDISPLMVAAALEKEAKTQDECVREGVSAASFPVRLRRVAALIASIECSRLRSEAPTDTLDFDDVIDRIELALHHTSGETLAEMHNELCEDEEPIRYNGDSLFVVEKK